MIALLFFSVVLETFSTVPFVLALLVFLSILEDKKTVLFFAFVGGLLLDVLLFRPLGSSSVFLTIFSFLIISYQSKFEADTAAFVGVFTFGGSYLYLLFTKEPQPLLTSITITALSLLVYKLYKRKKKKKW